MTTTFTDEQKLVSLNIANKLTALGLDAKFLPELSVGPLLTVYRFMPAGATRVSQLEAIASDIAIALHVEDVLVKRLPGESAVGFYVPNAQRRWVSFADMVAHVWTAARSMSIPLGLGVDHLGNPVVEDLAELPHLLIAGSTGGGKSTLLSSLLASLIYSVPSAKLSLVLSDTKQVEFGHFVGAPHLLYEPAQSVYRTLELMEWLIDEVNRRLGVIGAAGAHNILEYNRAARAPLAHIVFVIDELADLLLNDERSSDKRKLGKVAEGQIGKLAARARASGVHMIVATQRPSVDVIRGSIKSNFPARLTFRLPSEADSRTVLSTAGAEHLLKSGDCLYTSPLRAGLLRIHAPYTRLDEVKTAIAMAYHAANVSQLNL